jgi:hypothetical protein
MLAAQAPVAHTSWARLPAALAVAATTVCLLLALRTRHRPPRRCPPSSEDVIG